MKTLETDRSLRVANSPVDPLVELVSLANDTNIAAIVSGVGTHRFGEEAAGRIAYEPGDVESMIGAMRYVFELRGGKERSTITGLQLPVEIKDQVSIAAQKIELTGNTYPRNPRAAAAILLGGVGMAPLERGQYTNDLLLAGLLDTDTVVALGSEKVLNKAELERAGDYGKGAVSEFDLMCRALQQVFNTEFKPDDMLEGYDDKVPTGFEHYWRINHAEAGGKRLFVLSAPMISLNLFRSNGTARRDRANSADTFEMFRRVSDLGIGSRVVSITNAHFRRFQGVDARNILEAHGYTSEVVGFGPPYFGKEPKTSEELIQEILAYVNSLVKSGASSNSEKP